MWTANIDSVIPFSDEVRVTITFSNGARTFTTMYRVMSKAHLNQFVVEKLAQLAAQEEVINDIQVGAYTPQ